MSRSKLNVICVSMTCLSVLFCGYVSAAPANPEIARGEGRGGMDRGDMNRGEMGGGQGRYQDRNYGGYDNQRRNQNYNQNYQRDADFYQAGRNNAYNNGAGSYYNPVNPYPQYVPGQYPNTYQYQQTPNVQNTPGSIMQNEIR